MLLRYLSQIGKYFLMWKEIFNKQTKWPVMKNLIYKEIDDLIIGSLGIREHSQNVNTPTHTTQ